MVETMVTIHGRGALPGAVVGAMCGVVLARLGPWGLVFAGPMVALVAILMAVELKSRELSTAELGFAISCGMAFWVVR